MKAVGPLKWCMGYVGLYVNNVTSPERSMYNDREAGLGCWDCCWVIAEHVFKFTRKHISLLRLLKAVKPGSNGHRGY